jgi:hypothetical protein
MKLSGILGHKVRAASSLFLTNLNQPFKCLLGLPALINPGQVLMLLPSTMTDFACYGSTSQNCVLMSVLKFIFIFHDREKG